MYSSAGLLVLDIRDFNLALNMFQMFVFLHFFLPLFGGWGGVRYVLPQGPASKPCSKLGLVRMWSPTGDVKQHNGFAPGLVLWGIAGRKSQCPRSLKLSSSDAPFQAGLRAFADVGGMELLGF